MKKLIYIAILFLVFIACNSNKKQEVKINILNLQESFTAKDEVQFLNQFPKNFKQFSNYFGWDSENDKPQKLYKDANTYIDYWFHLLSDKKYSTYENNIIAICIDGKWEADGVSYFQDKSLKYIKENKRFNLINALEDTKAKSVLFFLFDGPHPKEDADFASHLKASKKKLLEELFETTFTNSHAHQPKPNNLSFYTNNDSYFTKDIDINNDGILDKVVSHERYQGDELLLFVNSSNTYELALKTINFSEDGGNIIKTIKKHKNGLVIITFFPDGGFLEAHHYVSFLNNEWILTNTVYKTKSSNQEDSFIYLCDVKQGVNLNDPNFLDDLKSIPDEADREIICAKEKEAVVATIDSASIKEIKHYIDKDLPSIYDYYKHEKIDNVEIWSGKLFGRCCSNADITFNENLFFKINSNYNNVKYPFTNLSDTSYLSAFTFKPNSEVKINLELNLEKSFLSGKYSNKNILKPDDIIMNPIKLSIINGYVKSKKTFYENARVKELKIYVNNIYIETVSLLDTPLVQEFKVNAVFKTNDVITLEPITYYKGTKYDDICISEIQTNLGETGMSSLNQKYDLLELINR